MLTSRRRVKLRGSLAQIQHRTLARFNRRNNKSTRRYAQAAERLHNEAAQLGADLDGLWEFVSRKLMKHAEDYARRYQNRRLDVGEFSEAMWDGVFKLLEKYGPSFDEALLAAVPQIAFWRNLLTALHRRGKNVIRKAKAIKKYEWWYNAQSYEAEFVEWYGGEEGCDDPTVNVESQALLNIVLDQAQDHPTLTDLERRLLQAIRQQPRATLVKWGSVVGISHPYTVKRKRDRLASKLKPLVMVNADDHWKSWVA